MPTLLPDPDQRRVRHRIVSVDDHLIEPPDLFEGRMPSALRNRAPRVVTASDGRQAWHYEEGQSWEDGGWSYRVLHTPGHSPGSVSFYFEAEGVLVSGDVLFRGSVGRSDLPGGNPRVLGASLKRLAGLPGATRVYPGHGMRLTKQDSSTFLYLNGKCKKVAEQKKKPAKLMPKEMNEFPLQKVKR